MPGDRKRTVETEFKVKDSFSAPVGKLASGFQKASGKLNELRDKFRDFRREQGLTTLGALGLGYGIGSWIEKTREANREFAATEKGIAGVLASSLKFEKGASSIDRYNRSLVLSRDITEKLEATGGRFNVGLDQVENSYRTIASAAGQLGLSQKQVIDLNEQAIATAKVFGADATRAATSIVRAVQTGTVRGFEPFDIKLRSVLGNMHKLTAAQRFAHVQKALQGSMQVADAMSTGIDASLNRAQQTVTGLLRDATGPLFKDIATSLDKWAKHLHDVREGSKPLVEIFSGKLVGAFHELEKVSKFIKEHWLAIAGVRVGTSLGANAGRIAETFGKLGQAIGGGGEGGVGGVSKGLAGMASQLGLVVSGLAAFKVGLDAVLGAVEDHLDKEREKDYQASSGFGSLGVFAKVAQKADALDFQVANLDAKTKKFGSKAIEEMTKSGMISNGKFNRGAVSAAVTRLSGKEREQWADQLGVRIKGLPVSQMSGMQFADAIAKQFDPVLGQYLLLAAQKAVSTTTKSDKNLAFDRGNTIINGNLNIEMKWEDQDPDRGFVRFQKKIQDGISKRRQPMGADGAAF